MSEKSSESAGITASFTAGPDDDSRWTATTFGGAFVAQPCNAPNSAPSRSIFRLAKQSSTGRTGHGSAIPDYRYKWPDS